MSKNDMLVTMTAGQLRDLIDEAVSDAVERVIDRPDRPLMRPRDVAALLQVSTRQVAKMLADGKLPGVRVEHQWRVRRDDLEAWICAQTKGTRNAA